MECLPDHVRLQQESPVLRVSCERIIANRQDKRRLVTTDTALCTDVMKTLACFDVRAIIRKALVDVLRLRSRRYGYFHLRDDVTDAYLAVTVSPDTVLRVRVTKGDESDFVPVLQTQLITRLQEILSDAGLSPGVQKSVHALMEKKENFNEAVEYSEGAERNLIKVRISYIGSVEPEVHSPKKSGGRWRKAR